MSILPEFSLIPDVFDSTTYRDPSSGNALLCSVLNEILQDGIITNLRDGHWYNYIQTCTSRNWYPNAMIILRSLFSNNKVHSRKPTLTTFTDDDVHWCLEAINLTSTVPLHGIVCSQSVFNSIGMHPKLSCISQLHTTNWWNNRNRTISINHNPTDFTQYLEPIVTTSNSLMIIDRFIDPGKKDYRKFIRVISSICSSCDIPSIEIHRVEYFGTNKSNIKNRLFWENRFRTNLAFLPASIRNKIEVFIWDEFHDRYIVTDVVGITSGNSFSLRNNKPPTRWTRLDSTARSDVTLEFDAAAGLHALKYRFQI